MTEGDAQNDRRGRSESEILKIPLIPKITVQTVAPEYGDSSLRSE